VLVEVKVVFDESEFNCIEFPAPGGIPVAIAIEGRTLELGEMDVADVAECDLT